jgi:hypothetical protein
MTRRCQTLSDHLPAFLRLTQDLAVLSPFAFLPIDSWARGVVYKGYGKRGSTGSKQRESLLGNDLYQALDGDTGMAACGLGEER